MKKLIWGIMIISFAVSCKRNVNAKERMPINQRIVKSLENKKDTKQNKNTISFTISCGSGCAMTYNEKSRKTFDNYCDVTFDVTMYQDEEITDSYKETYKILFNNGMTIYRDDSILDDTNPICDILKQKYKYICNKENTQTISTENAIKCKDISDEMSGGEECIIKNSSIKKEYQNILQNHLVDGSIYLLETIPNKNIDVKIDKDGLMDIEYIIKENKVSINLNYGGGVTEIILEQLNNDVKRSIIYNAD